MGSAKPFAKPSAKLALLFAIGKGVTTNKALALVLKKHQASVSKIANKCIALGLIQKIGYPFVFELTGKGRAVLFKADSSCAFPSLGERQFKNVRLHSVVFKFPILKDSSVIDWDKVSDGFRNSVKKYKRLDFPISVTIERTSKSVLLYLKEKEIEKKLFLTDFFSWVFKAVFFSYHFLNNKGLRFDFLAGEIIQQHVANPEPELNDKTDSKITVSQDLGRKVSSLFPSSQAAKAWIDRSLGDLEIETNDLLYEEKLILMPEKICSMEQRQAVFEKNLALFSKSVAQYNESNVVHDANIRKHLAVLGEMSDTLKLIREELKGGGNCVGAGAGSKPDSSIG